MNRRVFLSAASTGVLLAGCTSPQEDTPMRGRTTEIAPGTNRAFSFTVATSAPDQVWDLWTRPATWSEWDRGLKSASLDGEMALGSVGQIIPLSGPAAAFTVVAFEPKRAYAFETKLPGAVLRVERSFNAERTEFTHKISFSGFAAFAFAQMFGPGFRKALPPTMQDLKNLSERRI